jgi:sulfur dioxygenase
MLIRQLFDSETSTYTYLLADLEAKEAVLIDPVLEQVERDARLLRELELRLVATLETHVHADHVTGAAALREVLGSQVVLGARSGAEGADRLLDDGERVEFGGHWVEARLTPGHTDGCVTWVSDDRKAAFTGDALFIRGCGRTDFQQGDALSLYRSVHEKVFSLDDDAVIYPGHDYKGCSSSTVAEERRHNPRLGGGRTEAEFVAIMDGLKLPKPKKIDVAVPANLRCGTLPAEARS